MKKLIYALSILSFVLFIQCTNNKQEQTKANSTNITSNPPVQNSRPNVTVPPNMTPVSGPGALEPPQNAKGVWHFTCPKACPGGAGQSINCPKCGTKMEHNSLYHQPK